MEPQYWGLAPAVTTTVVCKKKTESNTKKILKTVAALASLAVMIMKIISTSIKNWVVQRALQEGIWQACYYGFCIPTNDIYSAGCKGLLNTIKAFDILTILFSAFTTILLVMLIWKVCRAFLPALLCAILTVIFSLIPWAVYLAFLAQCVSFGNTMRALFPNGIGAGVFHPYTNADPYWGSIQASRLPPPTDPIYWTCVFCPASCPYPTTIIDSPYYGSSARFKSAEVGPAPGASSTVFGLSCMRVKPWSLSVVVSPPGAMTTLPSSDFCKPAKCASFDCSPWPGLVRVDPTTDCNGKTCTISECCQGSCSSVLCDKGYTPKQNTPCPVDANGQCSKLHCCLANPTCSISSISCPSGYTAKAGSTVCAGATCLQSDCCTANPTCGSSSFACPSDYDAKAGSTVCAGATCLQSDCCVKTCRSTGFVCESPYAVPKATTLDCPSSGCTNKECCKETCLEYNRTYPCPTGTLRNNAGSIMCNGDWQSCQIPDFYTCCSNCLQDVQCPSSTPYHLTQPCNPCPASLCCLPNRCGDVQQYCVNLGLIVPQLDMDWACIPPCHDCCRAQQTCGAYYKTTNRVDAENCPGGLRPESTLCDQDLCRPDECCPSYTAKSFAFKPLEAATIAAASPVCDTSFVCPLGYALTPGAKCIGPVCQVGECCVKVELFDVVTCESFAQIYTHVSPADASILDTLYQQNCPPPVPVEPCFVTDTPSLTAGNCGFPLCAACFACAIVAMLALMYYLYEVYQEAPMQGVKGIFNLLKVLLENRKCKEDECECQVCHGVQMAPVMCQSPMGFVAGTPA